MTRTPIASLEAEEALIGAMLMSGRAIELAQDAALDGGDFHNPNHRRAFDAIAACADRGNVDELVVANYLDGTGYRHADTNYVWLTTLVERCPATANAKAYVDQVKRAALLRRLSEAGEQIAALAYDAEAQHDPAMLYAEAAAKLDEQQRDTSQGGFRSMERILGELYDELGQRHDAQGTMLGLSTGHDAVDDVTGGLRPDQLIVLAARPAMGKTAFMLNIIRHGAMTAGTTTALFNMEMSGGDLGARLISDLSEIPNRRLQSTTPLASDFEPITTAMGRWASAAKGRLFVDDTPGMTMMLMRQRARRLKKELEQRGRTLDLIAVDYLQLMTLGARVESRQLEVAAISRGLKILSRELRVPVLALSQLSRGLESRPDKTPMLSDLRDSGAIEQDADKVLFLHRPEVYDPKPEFEGRAVVVVAKNRQGRIGKIELRFNPRFVRFESLGKRVPGANAA